MKCCNPYVKIISKGDPFANPPIPDKLISFPCGKCVACRINKKREWTLRLQHEAAFSESAFFITLTYADANLKYDSNGLNCPCSRDLQLFIKRLRKRFPKQRIRYMINSEYGDNTKRVHYHGIIFNLPESILDGSDVIKRKGSISYHSKDFEALWGLGNAEIAEICPERIAYCCQYFVDKHTLEGFSPSISLMSRGEGIGKTAVNKLADQVRYYNLTSLPSHTGNKVKIPRYYRQKIYTDEERKLAFVNYVNNFQFTDEDLVMLDNHEDVEQARIQAIKFNKRKRKL